MRYESEIIISLIYYHEDLLSNSINLNIYAHSNLEIHVQTVMQDDLHFIPFQFYGNRKIKVN